MPMDTSLIVCTKGVRPKTETMTVNKKKIYIFNGTSMYLLDGYISANQTDSLGI